MTTTTVAMMTQTMALIIIGKHGNDVDNTIDDQDDDNGNNKR